MTLSRRDTIKTGLALAASGGTLAALHPTDAAAAAPEVAASATDPGGDYELTITLEFDFQEYSRRGTGVPTPATYGQYQIGAGRKDGAWRMYVQRFLADDWDAGEHVFNELIEYDVVDQLTGPDPLALMQALLGGQAVLDGTRVIHGLNRHELAALRLASPELRDELIALMGRNGLAKADNFANWFGRWALTAPKRDLEGFWHTNPSYQELAARVKSERLFAKAMAEQASEMAARAEVLASCAAREG